MGSALRVADVGAFDRLRETTAVCPWPLCRVVRMVRYCARGNAPTPECVRRHETLGIDRWPGLGFGVLGVLEKVLACWACWRACWAC
jgi:hypothetical protein